MLLNFDKEYIYHQTARYKATARSPNFFRTNRLSKVAYKLSRRLYLIKFLPTQVRLANTLNKMSPQQKPNTSGNSSPPSQSYPSASGVAFAEYTPSRSICPCSRCNSSQHIINPKSCPRPAPALAPAPENKKRSESAADQPDKPDQTSKTCSEAEFEKFEKFFKKLRPSQGFRGPANMTAAQIERLRNLVFEPRGPRGSKTRKGSLGAETSHTSLLSPENYLGDDDDQGSSYPNPSRSPSDEGSDTDYYAITATKPYTHL